MKYIVNPVFEKVLGYCFTCSIVCQMNCGKVCSTQCFQQGTNPEDN
ncbi:Cys-rich peptide, Clo7bot family [Gottschalkia purinilytica]|uniref:Cys-rich peptide, Clo7bot family n=1 Tax=Gottschalkia purinilytica TaxID=1503 RepID=A0A0L0WD63_GOTPU|nr:Clo7bot family Cys-rich peptide [Gottschalkia purinilytica]KNF09419.1 Cys-rich peptide, Clo7bot family [Gottschalkia purinilytica]